MTRPRDTQPLTLTQQLVLNQYAAGFTTREIAANLGRSHRTIGAHSGKIRGKAGPANGSVAAAILYLKPPPPHLNTTPYVLTTDKRRLAEQLALGNKSTRIRQTDPQLSRYSKAWFEDNTSQLRALTGAKTNAGMIIELVRTGTIENPWRTRKSRKKPGPNLTVEEQLEAILIDSIRGLDKLPQPYIRQYCAEPNRALRLGVEKQYLTGPHYRETSRHPYWFVTDTGIRFLLELAKLPQGATK